MVRVRSSVQPEQFSGSASLDAGILIKALSIDLEIGAHTDISVEGPSPFSLQADLVLNANLPDPLPDYNDKFHYKLTIPEITVNVQNPLVSVSLFSRFTSESKRTSIKNSVHIENPPDIKDDDDVLITPTVNCDINPVLSFEHEMNQNYGFIMYPGGTKTFYVGAVQFKPTLKTVIIREKEKKEEAQWHIVYSTESTAGVKPLIGTWLTDSDPSSPSAPSSKRLQLMTTNPLINTMHSNVIFPLPMIYHESDESHLSQKVLNDYPELVTYNKSGPESICIDFMYSGESIRKNNLTWSGLEFTSENDIIIEKNCLQFVPDMKIIFPEKINTVEIKFCTGNNIEVSAFADYECSLQVATVPKSISDSISLDAGDSSFTCLKFSNIKGGSTIKIKSLCYTTQKAIDDHQLNIKINEANKTLLRPGFLPSGYVFKPGCYYEIETQVQISGWIDESKIKEKNPVIKDFIRQQYQNKIDALPVTPWITYSYFQTEAPPQNLIPYIKWSLPKLQENKVFINDPIQFRFKRGYLKQLFGTDAFRDFQIKAYLKNFEEILLPIPNLKWYFSESCTLFPDEETWHNYLISNQLPDNNNSIDDILSIDMTSIDGYKVNNRYELYIVGMKRPDITEDSQTKNKNVLQISDEYYSGYYNILTSISFTTSRFDSFAKVFSSGVSDGKISSIILRGNISSFVTSNFDNETSGFIEAQNEYYRILVDYEYGIAKSQKDGITLVSKEAVENTKLTLRTAMNSLDEQFRSVALEINSEIFFADIENKLKVYAIKNMNDKIEIIWVKLPEPLKLKINDDSLERFICELSVDSKRIFNADTSQIIFKLSLPVSELSGIKLQAAYIKDFKDDSNTTLNNIPNNHHRYDKPSFKGINPGTKTIEGVTVNTIEDQGIIMESLEIEI